MAGRPSPLFLRPSAGFHELLRARGDDVIGVTQLRCLGSAWPAFSTTVAGGAHDRHSGRGVRPRRGFYSTEIIKQSVQRGWSVQNKQGIWCPRRATRVVKEGQCSGRKGPGKGRSPVAARAPLLGPGREGGGFYQRLRPPLGPRRFQGYGPASWPVSRLAGAVLHAQRSLPGPTRTPACMHGEETGLQRRGALGI